VCRRGGSRAALEGQRVGGASGRWLVSGRRVSGPPGSCRASRGRGGDGGVSATQVATQRRGAATPHRRRAHQQHRSMLRSARTRPSRRASRSRSRAQQGLARRQERQDVDAQQAVAPAWTPSALGGCADTVPVQRRVVGGAREAAQLVTPLVVAGEDEDGASRQQRPDAQVAAQRSFGSKPASISSASGSRPSARIARQRRVVGSRRRVPICTIAAL